MAIPFNVPSDEYTLDQYRRIHQLLLDLMDMLRGFTGGFGLPAAVDVQQPVVPPAPPIQHFNNDNDNGRDNNDNNNNNSNIYQDGSNSRQNINSSTTGNVRATSGGNGSNSLSTSAASTDNTGGGRGVNPTLPDLVVSTLNEAAIYFRHLEREEAAAIVAAIGSRNDNSGNDNANGSNNPIAERRNADDGTRPPIVADGNRIRRGSGTARRAGSRIRGKFGGKRKKDKTNGSSSADSDNDELVLHSIHCGWLQNRRSTSASVCSCMYQLGFQQNPNNDDTFSTSSSATDVTANIQNGHRPTERQRSYRCFLSRDYRDTTTVYNINNDANQPCRIYRHGNDCYQQLEQKYKQTSNYRKLNCPQEKESTTSVPYWLRIGEELRKVAESFKSSRSDVIEENDHPKNVDLKDSLLAVLLPNHLGRTMIATVLIYIGWKLLKTQ